MKTTNESYQNQTKKENQRIKLRYSFATSRIYKNYLSQIIKKNKQNKRLINLKFFNILLTERKKITFDKFIQNKIRLENRISKHENIISIKPVKEQSLFIPTTTQNKSNIERIKTQINQTFKKRTRNSTTFDYALFLHTVRKITTKKFLSIANKKRVKTDTLRRVHTLLVHEHNRLNKVA